MDPRPAVLIVDDDLSGRAMLSLSLRQAGLSVRTAAGGEEALHLLREERFGWLITDARMLPMDGFELSEKAKELRPGLHVGMISALCSEKDIQGRPIERFFAKPLHADDIICWITRCGV